MNLRHGFTLERTKELKEIAATMYLYTHEKTGLRLLWLKRDDDNKTFAISFATQPWDDTGVFHILEHSVLCGSDLYPVKEPFVELLKSSLNTFLNAITFPDKTMYPVCSRNDKDFINLTRVYLDAVFRPMIARKEEIFMQEGWHIEFEDGKPSYKGVVFNEMKGAFANPDELIETELWRMMFPDTTYGFNSGGDPTAIPTLTYENFMQAYRRFYAPSNATVLLDGDLNLDEVLTILDEEYLSHYEKTQRVAPPALQKPVKAEGEIEYELSPDEPVEGRLRLCYGKVLGTFDQRERIAAMEALCQALTATNQSPLTRAILSEGLAENVSLSVQTGMLQPNVFLDVENIREENLDRLEDVLWRTIEAQAGQLDHDEIEAILTNMEFKHREADYGSFPKGLVLSMNVMDSWLYGGEPEAFLEVGTLYDDLRKKLGEGYFEALLREVLIDNPHSCKLLLRPSHEAGEKRRKEEQDRLETIISRWTPEQKQAALDAQARLQTWHDTPDTPEQLATLPRLTIDDLPAEPERIQVKKTEVCGFPLLLHSDATGGIVYANLYFNAGSCDAEELSCLAFLCSALDEADTAKHSAEEMTRLMRLTCGRFSVSPSCNYVAGGIGGYVNLLKVSLSARPRDLKRALELAIERLTESVFTEGRVRDVLKQMRTDFDMSMATSGHSLGIVRVRAQYTAEWASNEAVSGISFGQWLRRHDQEGDYANLIEKMNALLKRLINANTLIFSLNGADDEAVRLAGATLTDLLPVSAVPEEAVIRPLCVRKEGLAIPADVCFAEMGCMLDLPEGHLPGFMRVVGHVLNYDYLWQVIRVQGGAYGAGVTSSLSGAVGYYTYRDPSGAASLNRFRQSVDYLEAFADKTEDLTQLIIGTVAETFRLMTPRLRTDIGDTQYFQNTTWESICQSYREIIETTPDDLKAGAEMLRKALTNAGICLVGPEEKLKSCEDIDSIIRV
ncbi:MAG: insulinase family protein [Clostridia bacterium]|nr:insulinase family protein [Clostridia bacterium]